MNINISRISLLTYAVVIALIIGFGCRNSSDTLATDQLINKARKFYHEGNIDDAIKLYKKATKLEPDRVDLHYELGLVFYEGWRNSLNTAQAGIIAEGMLGHSNIDTSNNEELLMRHGYKKEFYNFALSEFNEVLKRDPSHWRARYYVGVDLFTEKKYDQAIAEFKKIIQVEQQDANNYSFLGEAYLKTDQYELAVETLKKALNLNPSAENYLLFGLACKKTGDRKKYREIAKKLKKMDLTFYSQLVNPSD